MDALEQNQFTTALRTLTPFLFKSKCRAFASCVLTVEISLVDVVE